MALAFAGFAIKMFLKKDGEFKKQCSSVHPKTGERLGCVCSSGKGDGSCHNPDNLFTIDFFLINKGGNRYLKKGDG